VAGGPRRAPGAGGCAGQENQLTLRNDRQFHPPLSGAAESAEQLILSCAPKSPSGTRRTLENEYF